MKRVSPESFIKAWQTSGSIEVVMKKTGMKFTAVRSRADSYRRKGVPLKKLYRHASYSNKKLDWKKLTEYARSLLREGG